MPGGPVGDGAAGVEVRAGDRRARGRRLGGGAVAVGADDDVAGREQADGAVGLQGAAGG
ncbi:hypothetical protein [Streptomyces sp. NPDC007264]|uniref:hypothetical protein n=1 Tax=Streptomyces sp. NPDC007264 TaxID=3364777 RepID=UPI0036DAD11D